MNTKLQTGLALLTSILNLLCSQAAKMVAWDLNETLPSLALELLMESKAVLWDIKYTSVQEWHKKDPS